MFRRSNLRIRLLVGCEGLEADTARFRYRKSGLQVGDPTCKLCHAGAETPQHFTMDCRFTGLPYSTPEPGSSVPTTFYQQQAYATRYLAWDCLAH